MASHHTRLAHTHSKRKGTTSAARHQFRSPPGPAPPARRHSRLATPLSKFSIIEHLHPLPLSRTTQPAAQAAMTTFLELPETLHRQIALYLVWPRRASELLPSIGSTSHYYRQFCASQITSMNLRAGPREDGRYLSNACNLSRGPILEAWIDGQARVLNRILSRFPTDLSCSQEWGCELIGRSLLLPDAPD